MQLDIRLPMGAMFAIMGLILTIYGLMSGPDIYAASLGINVNLYWGLVMLAFGLCMLLLTFNAARARDGQDIRAR